MGSVRKGGRAHAQLAIFLIANRPEAERGGSAAQSESNGTTACKTLEISEQTYYRWRREYGGMDTTKVKKLNELEKENTRLKRLVADLSLGS